MSTHARVIGATPDKIWSVLADGWLYPVFVVGASRMREVDDDWPAAGARLHHSVGSWPLLLDDRTEVLESRAPSLLRLRAHGWPAGAADVELALEPRGDHATEVTITEHLVRGPVRLVPRLLSDPAITWRNVETLRRLAFLAERRP